LWLRYRLVCDNLFFFQAEDGIRDRNVTGVQTLLFRSIRILIEVGDEVILDAGDDEDSYPLNGFYNGVEYKVTDMNPDHEKEGVIEIGDNSRGNPGYPRLDQVKLVRKPEDIEESTKEFNVGDYAKVVGETYNDDILAGAIVKIYREKDVDGDYRIDLVDGSDY